MTVELETRRDPDDVRATDSTWIAHFHDASCISFRNKASR